MRPFHAYCVSSPLSSDKKTNASRKHYSGHTTAYRINRGQSSYFRRMDERFPQIKSTNVLGVYGLCDRSDGTVLNRSSLICLLHEILFVDFQHNVNNIDEWIVERQSTATMRDFIAYVKNKQYFFQLLRNCIREPYGTIILSFETWSTFLLFSESEKGGTTHETSIPFVHFQSTQNSSPQQWWPTTDEIYAAH